MAKDTPLHYRNLVIYEVYVRNHGPNGTFADVEADLERLQAMGVDIVWFMPIHPIGQLNKKGRLGCPYSIRDYREVNPEYGTKADFARLIEHAQMEGLGVQVDSAVEWVLLVVESHHASPWLGGVGSGVPRVGGPPRSILRCCTEAANATIQRGHDEYPSVATERSTAG